LIHLKKSARLIAICMLASLKNPFAKSVVCRLDNPGTVTTSPIPWWGSGVLIIVGLAAWILSELYSINGLGEAARLLVYIPLGNIFGMTQQALRK
jgi:hypothetical protein